MFSIRAGVLNEKSFQKNITLNNVATSWGFGINFKRSAIDIAFIDNKNKNSYNLFPVILKDITWIITYIVSKTNNPPTIARTISFFAIMATEAKEPPKDNEPVSPIKIFAGGALNHKKPRQDPTIDPQKIEVSPTLAI